MSHKYHIYDNENKIVSSGCNIRRRKETPFTIKTLAGQLYEMVAEPCDTVGTLHLWRFKTPILKLNLIKYSILL